MSQFVGREIYKVQKIENKSAILLDREKQGPTTPILIF